GPEAGGHHGFVGRDRQQRPQYRHGEHYPLQQGGENEMMPCSRLFAARHRSQSPRSAHRFGRAGTTMVEVLVVFGIISVFTTALFSLFLGSLKTYDTGISKGVSDTNVSMALQKAARAVADGMSASVSSGQLLVQLP